MGHHSILTGGGNGGGVFNLVNILTRIVARGLQDKHSHLLPFRPIIKFTFGESATLRCE